MQVLFISIAIEDPVVTMGSLKEIKRNSLRDTVLQPSQRGMRKKKHSNHFGFSTKSLSLTKKVFMTKICCQIDMMRCSMMEWI